MVSKFSFLYNPNFNRCDKDPRFYVTGPYSGARRKREDADPACSPRTQAAARKLCGMITNPKGPFQVCYGNEEMEAAYEACVVDYCIDPKFGINNLEAYAGFCGQFGELGPWRAEAGASKNIERAIQMDRPPSTYMQT